MELDSSDREDVALVKRIISDAEVEMRRRVTRAISSTNSSIWTRAKGIAKARLTSRADVYISSYITPTEENVIGLHNIYRNYTDPTFDVVNAIEWVGTKGHLIYSKKLKMLIYPWFSIHIPDTLSEKGGDDKVHVSILTRHPGIKPKFIIRDAVSAGISEDLPKYINTWNVMGVIREE